MKMSLFSDEQILKAYTKDIERQTAERVERETAQRVERETAQRIERETAQRVERESAHQFALRLLKLGGMSEEKIAEATMLSIQEVKALAEEAKNAQE